MFPDFTRTFICDTVKFVKKLRNCSKKLMRRYNCYGNRMRTIPKAEIRNDFEFDLQNIITKFDEEDTDFERF